MNWTADDIRQLRYRLGWSRAELARSLNCDLQNVIAWEAGGCEAGDPFRNPLLHFYHQAEMNSDQVLRRPVAERLMHDRNLTQIHDMEVIDCLANGALRNLDFKS